MVAITIIVRVYRSTTFQQQKETVRSSQNFLCSTMVVSMSHSSRANLSKPQMMLTENSASYILLCRMSEAIVLLHKDIGRLCMKIS